MKFGLLIDSDLMKAVISTNTKPEVIFSGRIRHLEKSICRHMSDMEKIWQFYAEFHADNDDVVKVKAGRIIPIWLTFVFEKRK